MGHLLELLSVGGEYLGLGYKSYICPVMVDHRKIPGTGLLELYHHSVHLVINIDICRSGTHEIIDMQLVVLVLLEHIPSDVFQ